MEDDRSAKFKGKGELRLEDLAHERRDVAHFETVEPDFSDAGLWIGNQPETELPGDFWSFDSAFFQRLPRMDAEEIAADKKLANRRVAAGNMAVGVGQPDYLFFFPTSGIAVTTASVASRSLQPR